MTKAFIFDMDGVIIDSEPIHTRVKRETFRHFGLEFADEDFDRYMGGTSGLIFRDVLAKSGRKDLRLEDLVEYNFDTAPTLHVPGDWNTQKEDLLNFEGNIWYRRQFECHTDGKRRFIHFDAVNYECQVYLNGRKIGVHEGGFSPFNIEITDVLKDGTNTLILKVDNRRRIEGVPTVNGITRQVNVISVPKVFIRDYFIQLKKGTSNTVAGWVQVDGAGNGTVTIEVPELKIKQQVSTDADGYGTFEFKCKPTLWSPENPKLYAVRLSLDTDSVEDEIGLRTIETRGKEIYLNGKKLFCRGISIHEEAPLRPGRAWSKEDASILLGWAKEMNCNFVRLAHYQHNENMIRIAERMGLLVWSEIPCYWTIQWENEGTLDTAREQIEAMIGRDKNRTNIIIWSIANETPISEPRNIFLRKLADKVRSMDDTRLVAAAMEKKDVNAAGIAPASVLWMNRPSCLRIFGSSARRNAGSPMLNTEIRETCVGCSGYVKVPMIENTARRNENIFL